MVFSSIPFLCYFLPAVILVYFAVPKALKNLVLLVFSLGFYAWGEPRYIFLMLGAIAVNYILGILTEKFRGRALSKLFLTLSVIFCLGTLGYFKYADFFIENLNKATGLSIPLLNIALPIGISFYTFQIMSYVIDVYRGNTRAQKNIINLGTYVALFPQLIAGPIVRYTDVEKSLTERAHSSDKAYEGIRRFVLGLSKKVILANSLGELGAVFGGADERSVLFHWLFVLSYMLQVYFDFSGYSDMAIGLGKIFGFDFPENFRYPFISKSVSEFWRRWHISLGSWFRDYVYIPLGGNRCKKARQLFNIFAVWFLTGFWHGAEWNFVIWGLYFALFLVLEKFFLGKHLEKHRAVSHIFVLLVVSVSFAVFSASSLGEAADIVGGMFGFGKIPLVCDAFVYCLKNYLVTIILSAICATPLLGIVYRRLKNSKVAGKMLDIAELPALVMLVLVSVAYLADGSFNPFLYFRF